MPLKLTGNVVEVSEESIFESKPNQLKTIGMFI